MPTNEYDRALGTIIRRYRAEAGMSQTKLANAVGMTFQQVQKYEKGANRVNFGRLVELSDALGVPTDRLVREARELAEGRSMSGEEVQAVADRSAVPMLSAINSLPPDVSGAMSALVKACRRN